MHEIKETIDVKRLGLFSSWNLSRFSQGIAPLNHCCDFVYDRYLDFNTDNEDVVFDTDFDYYECYCGALGNHHQQTLYGSTPLLFKKGDDLRVDFLPHTKGVMLHHESFIWKRSDVKTIDIWDVASMSSSFSDDDVSR